MSPHIRSRPTNQGVEAVRRFRRGTIPAGDDIVSRVFGSEDFHAAVAAFATKQPVVWQGR